MRFLSFPRYQPTKVPVLLPASFLPSSRRLRPDAAFEASAHRFPDGRWVPCCHCILLAVRPLYRQSTQREEPDKVHMSAPPLLGAQRIELLDAFAALVGLVFLVGLSALVGLAALVGLLLLVSLAESADLIRLIDLVALVPIVRSSLQLPQFPIGCSRYRSGFRPAFQPSRFGGPLSWIDHNRHTALLPTWRSVSRLFCCAQPRAPHRANQGSRGSGTPPPNRFRNEGKSLHHPFPPASSPQSSACSVGRLPLL